MPRQPLILVSLLSSLVLGACATSQESGRTRLAASHEVVALHSDVEVEAQLIFKPDANCEAEACEASVAFQRQVAALAQKLGPAAIQLATEQGQQAPHFEVTTPAKDEIGTLSSASGKVVVFDGLRRLALPEAVLAFLITREMGHVMAGHHVENSTTSIAVSIAVALLFPVAGILQGAEAAYTASTLASSLTSTAASRLIQNIYREDQRREADAIALRILVRAGWTPQEVDDALHRVAPLMIGDGWMAELRTSRHWLDQITMGPPYQFYPDDADEQNLADTVLLAPALVPVTSSDLGSLAMMESETGDPGWPGVRIEARQAFAPVMTPRQKVALYQATQKQAKQGKGKRSESACVVHGVRYQAGSKACARPPASKPKTSTAKYAGKKSGGRKR